MDKSEKIDELVLALSRAQGEFQAVPFNAVNPFLKNRYADLGAVIEAAKEILSNHQLVVTQTVSSTGNSIGVTTMLAHSSGQWICDTVSLPLSDEKGKSLAQVAGSVVTYLRRYAYSAILGLYADEDTDGSEPEKKTPQKQEIKKPVVQTHPVEDKKDDVKKSIVSEPNKTVSATFATEATIWFDKSDKPADGLIDIKTINAIMEKFVGKGKALEAAAHLKNHLRKYYHVDTLKEMTWKKAKALITHLKGEGDDPDWYPPEELQPKEDGEEVDDSDVDKNTLVVVWKKDANATFVGLPVNEQERINDMLALVKSGAIKKDDYKAMVEVLEL